MFGKSLYEKFEKFYFDCEAKEKENATVYLRKIFLEGLEA